MTSGLAFVPMPATATYSATKAALHSYTLSLRVKLAGKLEVIEIAPPEVLTGMVKYLRNAEVEGSFDEVLGMLTKAC